jgi:tetratricopeptide (TPR) repeat protein
MSESPNKLIKFWQELKRRKTGKVIVAYAATAFILLQLSDILTPALLLPAWTTRLITLILIIGFPVAVIFSWIFDITPEGIKKTNSTGVSESKGSVKTPSKRILSVSNIIIAALIIVVAILAYPKIFKQDTLERLRSSGGRISVAVLPFQNMTNDTTWNIWQDGIQNELITSLTNSEELKIRQTETINNLIQSKGLANYASITPSIARILSQNLDANVFIFGTIKQAGSTIRLNAQLIDSRTEEVFKSFQIEGNNKEEKIFQLADSLSNEIKNFLIISKLKQGYLHDSPTFVSTNSPEAFRYFLNGRNYFYKEDYNSARDMFFKALAIDSNINIALTYISTSYGNQGLYDEAKNWCLKAYKKREQMPMILKLLTKWLYANNFETPHEEIIHLRDILEIDDQSSTIHYIMGNAYEELYQYDKAIPEYEKSIEIFKKWDSKPRWSYSYTDLGYAYHEAHKYKKEKELYKKAELYFSGDPEILYRQAILAFTEKDTVKAKKYIDGYISGRRNLSHFEPSIMNGVAGIYSEAGIMDKAEKYYCKALSLQPEDPDRINNLAYFLIDKDRDLNEGLELVDKALFLSPDDFNYLDTKGWGLYKLEKYMEALDLLQKSWDTKPVYSHEIYLHLEAAKKAVAGQKNIP